MQEKRKPTGARFFLAEDIRMEAGGKPLLLGLYVDDTILVDMPDSDPELSYDQPIVLNEMAVLASFPGTSGKFTGKLSITDSSGKILLQTGEGEFQTENNGILNIVSRFRPFIFERFGKFKFVVELDENHFEFNFTILRNIAPPDTSAK